MKPPGAADLGEARRRLPRHRRVDPNQGAGQRPDQGDPQALASCGPPDQGASGLPLRSAPPDAGRPQDRKGRTTPLGPIARHRLFVPGDQLLRAFRGAYCVMGGWQNREVIAAQNATGLAAVMAPVVFHQAKKADWLPLLPRKDMTIRDYKMSEEQQRQYNQMERQFLLQLNNDETITVEVAIAKYAEIGADPNAASSMTRTGSFTSWWRATRTPGSICCCRF